MKKLVLAAAVIGFGFLISSEASAVTVLTTTQADVKKQCAGKTKCSTACGSTICNYVCDKPKKQCTATVYMTPRPPIKRPPRPTTTDSRQ